MFTIVTLFDEDEKMEDEPNEMNQPRQRAFLEEDQDPVDADVVGDISPGDVADPNCARHVPENKAPVKTEHKL